MTKVDPTRTLPTPPPIAKLPFDSQKNIAKERINYLSEEYFKTDILSLSEIIGPYGDHQIENPNLYDWNKVLNELEGEGYIEILQRTENNIVFKVLARNSWRETIVLDKKKVDQIEEPFEQKVYKSLLKLDNF